MERADINRSHTSFHFRVNYNLTGKRTDGSTVNHEWKRPRWCWIHWPIRCCCTLRTNHWWFIEKVPEIMPNLWWISIQIPLARISKRISKWMATPAIDHIRVQKKALYSLQVDHEDDGTGFHWLVTYNIISFSWPAIGTMDWRFSIMKESDRADAESIDGFDAVALYERITDDAMMIRCIEKVPEISPNLRWISIQSSLPRVYEFHNKWQCQLITFHNRKNVFVFVIFCTFSFFYLFRVCYCFE